MCFSLSKANYNNAINKFGKIFALFAIVLYLRDMHFKCFFNEWSVHILFSLFLHAFKDGTHYAIVAFKPCSINASTYYDLINPYLVFCVLHVSNISQPDLKKNGSTESHVLEKVFTKYNQLK